ncbi:MAG: FMN-binding protein [Coriobacteriia bacterium]|nr:FMN-binding protein [Coriobacteriia bacterium]
MRDNVYVRLGIPVLVVCIAAAAGLALTWTFTADKIEAQAREAEKTSLAAVLPDAASFEAVTDAAVLAKARAAAGDVGIDGVFNAVDSAGATAGTGYLVASRGYSGPIRMAVGLDRNGLVSGVMIVTMAETPGLGTKIVDDKTYLPKYTGLDSADKAKKVDTITGATKSSRGVRKGVEAALAAFAATGGAEGGGSK